MFLIYNGHTAVLLLSFTLRFVFVFSKNVEIKNLTATDIVNDCLNISWIRGLDCISRSPESSRATKVQTFVRGVDAGEEWALEMLDDLLKIEKEIRENGIQDIKNHDPCIAAKEQYDNITVHDTGCAMVSRGHDSMTDDKNDCSSTSACHGQTKNENDMMHIVSDAVQNNSLTNGLHPDNSSSSQARVTLNDLTTAEICAISVFSAIFTLLIACTVCDIVRRTGRRGSKSTTVITLSKLSLYTNALAILSLKVTPNMMPAIHGMRCLSCFLIIFGHHCAILMLVFEQEITVLEILKAKNSWLSLMVMMAPFAVDTFLLITGFLTSHLFFKAVHSGVKINWPSMYLLRYFRITPAVAALVLLAAIFSHRLGMSPFGEAAFSNWDSNCQETWWVYLLHIQNLVTNGSKCLPHGWYTAVDMQLFWISPFILYPLNRWPKFGLALLSSLLVVSIVLPAIVLATNGYFNAILRFDMAGLKLMENFENYYMPTYTRACPYFIGILLGYDVAKKKRHLSQINVTINWLVAATLMSFCTWFTSRIYNSNFAYDWSIEIVFAAVSRPCWAIVNAWIIYACTQGYGGLVTRFLSLPLFFPVSRLAYSIYLVHFGIQGITSTWLEGRVHSLDFELVLRVCCDAVMSIAAAFIFNLFFESPTIVLSKIFVNRSLRKSDQVPATAETENAPVRFDAISNQRQV